MTPSARIPRSNPAIAVYGLLLLSGVAAAAAPAGRLVCGMLLPAPDAHQEGKRALSRAVFTVEAVEGDATPQEAERLADALLRELARRGRLDPASERLVRIEAHVAISSPEPMIAGAAWAGEARPVSLFWVVRDGERYLGTFEQSRRLPLASDVWSEITVCAVGPGAGGILQLLEEP